MMIDDDDVAGDQRRGCAHERQHDLDGEGHFRGIPK
jgi:hypothetical protein